MAYNIRPIDRDQQFLLAPSIADWLPKGHLAWTVIEVVDAFDLSAFTKSMRQDGKGGANYAPQMMVALVLYAYCIGIRSSRKIEKCCYQDVAFRVLTANTFPDHATIARFVAKNQDGLSELFSQMLSLCVSANMVDLSVLAIDGTKMAADASRDNTCTLDEIARRAIKEAIQTDEQEDQIYGDRRGDELPELLGNRDWIRQQLDLLKEQKQKRNDSNKAPKVNTTDPDSRLMKTTEGIKPAYNGQIVVTKDQLILGAEVSQDANDSHQLSVMTQLVSENLRSKPNHVIADSGYWDAFQIAASHAQTTLVPPKSQLKSLLNHVSTFEIQYLFKKVERQQLSQSQAARAIGIDNRRFSAWFNTYKHNPDVAMTPFRMRDLFEDPHNRAMFAKRKSIVEPVFGQIKANRSFRRFTRRGLLAVSTEWKLIAITHNLLKYWKVMKQRLVMA